MAYYDEPLDEDDRRRRREEGLPPTPYTGSGNDAPDPGTDDSDPFGGVDPSSGSGTVGPAAPLTGGAPATPTTPPAARFEPPQSSTPSSYRPPGPEVPGAKAFQLQQPAITDDVTNILRARLNELKNPGDVASDPIYQNALRAYQIANLRGQDRERKALAERSAAGGTRSTGGFNVGVRGIAERGGERAAQYSSGLALERLSAREKQLTDAIQIARAVGQDDIANQLEVQRLQLQAELGRGDLALRGELGRGQLGLGYDNLGLSYADLIMRGNAAAVNAAGGGG